MASREKRTGNKLLRGFVKLHQKYPSFNTQVVREAKKITKLETFRIVIRLIWLLSRNQSPKSTGYWSSVFCLPTPLRASNCLSQVRLDFRPSRNWFWITDAEMCSLKGTIYPIITRLIPWRAFHQTNHLEKCVNTWLSAGHNHKSTLATFVPSSISPHSPTLAACSATFAYLSFVKHLFYQDSRHFRNF